MKKLFLGLALATFATGTVASAANITPASEMATAIKNVQLLQQYLAVPGRATQAINWPVGDYQNLVIKFLFPGSGHKEVTKEETVNGQVAFWYVSTTVLLGKTQKVEQLINRADGTVIKTVVDGQEQAPSNDQSQIEIIDQSETTVTVPAGTFDCLYVKAKITQQGQQPQEVELWVNPIDVNLDGALKIALKTQFGPLSMELKDFGPRH